MGNENNYDEEIVDNDQETSEDIESTEDELDQQDGSEEEVDETSDDEQADENQQQGVDEEALARQRLEALRAEEEKVRKQVTELKAERRKARDESQKNPIVDKKQSHDTLLQDINPEDVALVERILQAKGYVKKDEYVQMTRAEKMQSLQDSWLKEHPEYLPENDPDDRNWEALKQELSYYAAPSKPEKILDILNRAHGVLNPKSSIPVKNPAKAQAAQQKIASSGKGAGSSRTAKSTNSSNKSIDPNVFIGFDDDELDELQK